MKAQQFLKSSQLLVLVVVVVFGISALLIYAATISILFSVVVEFVRDFPSTADSGKYLVIKLLKIMDLMLIAITFQIIAISLYRLFIQPLTSHKSTFLGALEINNFHDLKATLIQISVLILLILFLEQAVLVGATLQTLYLGCAVGVVIVSSVFAWKNMREAGPAKPADPAE